MTSECIVEVIGIPVVTNNLLSENICQNYFFDNFFCMSYNSLIHLDLLRVLLGLIEHSIRSNN